MRADTEWDIKIVADTNDADYVTEVSTITDDDLNELKPLIDAIKAFKPYTVEVDGMKWTHHHNFPCGEYAPREDLGEKSVEELYPHVNLDALELFSNHRPYGEHGIHTIKSIEVTPAVTWTKLL